MNEAILEAVEMLLFISQPALGQWQDPSSLQYRQKLNQLIHNLKSVRSQCRALDLLLAVPGV